jgi:hypothetical protein
MWRLGIFLHVDAGVRAYLSDSKCVQSFALPVQKMLDGNAYQARTRQQMAHLRYSSQTGSLNPD